MPCPGPFLAGILHFLRTSSHRQELSSFTAFPVPEKTGVPKRTLPASGGRSLLPKLASKLKLRGIGRIVLACPGDANFPAGQGSIRLYDRGGVCVFLCVLVEAEGDRWKASRHRTYKIRSLTLPGKISLSSLSTC